MKGMYLAQEDREGKEGATKISPGSTSSGAALTLAAAASSATLADKDDEELESKAPAWLAARKNNQLHQLAEYASKSIAGSSVDSESLLLDRARSASAASAAKSLSGRLRARPKPSRGSWSAYGSPGRITMRGTLPPFKSWRVVRPSWIRAGSRTTRRPRSLLGSALRRRRSTRSRRSKPSSWPASHTSGTSTGR